MSRTGMAIGATGIFLGLHVMVLFWHPFFVWGVDFLAYGSHTVSILFVVASVFILCAGKWWGRLDFSRFHGWRVGVLVVVLGMGVFFVFRAQVPLLGDGQLLLRELEGVGEQWLRTDRAPLAFWLIRNIYTYLGFSVLATYQFYSIVSGVMYLAIVVFGVGFLIADRMLKWVLGAVLLTPGYMQLFFGYVENYALLYPVVLLYLLVGLHTLRGHCSIWWCAVLFGFLIPLHFSTATLGFSLCVVFWYRIVKDDKRSVAQKVVAGVVFWGLPVVCAGVILSMIQFDVVAYWQQPKGNHVLPLSGVDAVHYGLFAWDHVFDLANMYFLTAPFAVVVLPVLLAQKLRFSHDDHFLFGAALGAVAFTLVANPEIGFFRDWDVMALPALPLTLWAGLKCYGVMTNRDVLLRVVGVCAGGAFLHTICWIGIQADTSRAIGRYHYVLSTATLSTSALSYGWETLGTYYRGREDFESAYHAYQQALQANPKHHRHWNAVGTVLLAQGDLDAALSHFQRAWALNNNFAEAAGNIGIVYEKKEVFEDAALWYQKALALSPDLAGGHERLAALYIKQGNLYFQHAQYDSARDVYAQALELKPQDDQIRYNLGLTLYRLQAYEDVVQILKPLTEHDTVSSDVLFVLGMSYLAQDHLQLGKDCLNRLLAQDPDHPQASRLHTLLQLLP